MQRSFKEKEIACASNPILTFWMYFLSIPIPSLPLFFFSV